MNLKDDMNSESVKVNCESAFALAKAFETVYKLEETEKQKMRSKWLICIK